MAQDRGMGRSEHYKLPTVSGKNYLLAIGIDTYQHWQPLSNAVKDVEDFTQVLLKQYQFETDYVYTLLNDSATETNIYQAIRDMKKRLEPTDNLVVYYSGHGHYDNDFDEGYWIPVDAQPNDESDYISNANIVKRLNALNTHHTLLIVDSCFSGSLVVRKRNAMPDEQFKSRRIIASGRHETVSDGKKGENSPFAAGLLTLLRKNTSPRLDTTSVIKYVKDYVYGKANQHPVDGRIQNSADEGGEFVFHLRKDEEAVWAEVSTTSTVNAYRDYLAGFPEGKYSAPAKRKIAALEEDEVWANAQRDDMELSYESYLRTYSPSGKYITQAKERLSSLQTEREKRQTTQSELAEREQKREQLRQTYTALVNEAESLYQSRQLDAARDKYREAIQTYMPGFVPAQRYLEEQYNFCQTNLDFLHIYEHGKQAMDDGNHRLAIEYFQEALKIKHVPKVEDMVTHCEQQLKSGTRSKRKPPPQQTATARTVTAPVSKPKKRIGLWVGLGALGMLMVLYMIGSSMENEAPLDDGSMDVTQHIVPQTTEEDTYDRPVTKPTPPPTVTIASQLLGTWQVDEASMTANGMTYDLFEMMPEMAYLRGTTYNFFPNGTVIENSVLGQETYTYSVTEAADLYIAIQGYGMGKITRINDHYLVTSLPYSVDGINVVMMTFEMSR